MNMKRSRSHPLARLILFVFALGTAASMLSGCAQVPLDEDELAFREEGPLGGEALQQRKHDLDRAYRDMVHFQTTMQSLIDRHDSRSLAAFALASLTKSRSCLISSFKT